MTSEYIMNSSSIYAFRKIEKLELAPGKTSIQHYIEADTLLLAAGGSVEAIINDQPFAMHYGAIIACSAGSVLEYRAKDRHGALIYHLMFTCLRPSVQKDNGLLQYVPIVLSEDRPYRVTGLGSDHPEQLLAWSKELWQLQLDMQTAASEQNAIALNMLLYRVLHAVFTKDAGAARSAADDQHAIEQAIRYLQQHYHTKIARKELARIAGMNIKQFTIAFQQCTGMSFLTYLNRLRIDKAKQLLLTRDSKLSAIARQVGYTDEFYFSRKFKQTVGTAPSVYIKRPKRIATLEHAYGIDLLTLGIAPCAAVTNSWLSQKYKRFGYGEREVARLPWGMPREEKLRRLVEAAPDLIIDGIRDEEETQRLRRIAPVIPIPWQGVSWRQHFLIVADLLGLTKRAEQWLQYFDEQAHNARTTLAAAVGKAEMVALLNIRRDHFIVYGSGYMGADMLYDVLQLRSPTYGWTEGVECYGWQELDPLRLTELDAHHIFLAVEDHPAARERCCSLQQLPQWRRLTAARNHAVYEVDMSTWYGYGPLAIEEQLQEAVHRMSGLKSTRNSPLF